MKNTDNLSQARTAMNQGRLDEAAATLKSLFQANPENVDVLRSLAELGRHRGQLMEAAELLRQAIILRPDLDAARFDLLQILMPIHQHEEASNLAGQLLSKFPNNLQLMWVKAVALMRLGDHQASIVLFEKILTQGFDKLGLWMMYGHCLKSVGRLSDGINAYKQALIVDPSLGDAWWSLANIKTYRFSPDEIEKMKAGLQVQNKNPIDRSALHFALAKALEDNNGTPEEIFHHYSEGNKLKRSLIQYDREKLKNSQERAATDQTREFFEGRKNSGIQYNDPIFVIGMPRSGSTLIEQILASHSQIEATNELHTILEIAARLSKGHEDFGIGGIGYMDRLSRLNGGQLRALGEEYLEKTKIQRKTNRPLFIDKMPANWRHVGLIHLILPNAKIIDARRHPLDCCFSNFRQNYWAGHHNSYDFEDMGQFYVDYVHYMSHIDNVLPGLVHRVIHEYLIDNTEQEIRKLLEYIGVPFEDACLEFWKTERTVKTPSSEQVRRPINKDGVDLWKPYDPWLSKLKSTLGDVLTMYPQAPNI